MMNAEAIQKKLPPVFGWRWLAWGACAVACAACSDDAPPKIVEVSVVRNTPDTVGPYEVRASVVDDRQVERVVLWTRVQRGLAAGSVSYTHLTLPTKA